MVSEFGIVILPDLLANNLELVIVGTAAGRVSARRGLYYAGGIGSGARFTKSASRRLNCGRANTVSCSIRHWADGPGEGRCYPRVFAMWPLCCWNDAHVSPAVHKTGG